MSTVHTITMKRIDNVATATAEIAAESDIFVDVGGQQTAIHVLDKIPFGHKIAIKDINKGERIIKYGEVIGVATIDILIGQHVHVHNLIGCRGRGDLEKSPNRYNK